MFYSLDPVSTELQTVSLLLIIRGENDVMNLEPRACKKLAAQLEIWILSPWLLGLSTLNSRCGYLPLRMKLFS